MADPFDVVICPGCGDTQPKNNHGCKECGYENGDYGRLLTIAELLAKPSYPADGALCLNEVSSAFLRALVAEAYRDAAEVARWSAATHWHSAKISEEAGERGAYLLARGRAQGHEMASDAIEARAKEVLGNGQ